MKQKESIVRILMASVIMFGVQTTASAQFGGLKKLAKKAVSEKVAPAQESSSTSSNDAVSNYRKDPNGRTLPTTDAAKVKYIGGDETPERQSMPISCSKGLSAAETRLLAITAQRQITS